MMKITALLFTLCFQLPALAQFSILVNENTLIPEGIAIDSRNGNIYVSSIAKNKILEISQKGEAVDFIKTGEAGFLEGLGMKVDTKRNILWALSNKREGKRFTSQIHGFDLDTKEVRYHHSFSDTLPHLLNDLVIDTYDNLVITDTYSSGIYIFYPSTKKFELHITSPKMRYPNGLAFGKDQQLYVATYGNGLLQIDMNSKAIRQLGGSRDSVVSHGLDGLVYNDGKLYGVYNADTSKGSAVVMVYTLDEKNTTIVTEMVLDKGNPDFFDPTTAAIYDNKLYVIANSHLDLYNKNGESIIGIEKQLQPLRLLVYQLKN